MRPEIQKGESRDSKSHADDRKGDERLEAGRDADEERSGLDTEERGAFGGLDASSSLRESSRRRRRRRMSRRSRRSSRLASRRSPFGTGGTIDEEISNHLGNEGVETTREKSERTKGKEK